MPICFKKSKSLYSKTFELPLFKFINLIMRNGLRERALKAVTLSFNKCFSNTTPTLQEENIN
jgi:ribosomal protein S7